MAYRKIEVDGKEYEYVVGKSNVKVKGVGVWDKHAIGYVIDDREARVQPSHVVDAIRSAVKQVNK
jgi:hypothetical protein